MNRFPYTQIDRDVLPNRPSVLGYVKVGGLEDRVRFTRNGKPWVAPTRYTNPARLEITTREQRIEDVQGTGQSEGQKFSVHRGYLRDEKIHAKLGAQPNEIDVRLMFPRWDQNFICHFGAHSGKKWVCQGNGVEAQDIVRGIVPCPCPRLGQFKGTYAGPKPSEDDGRPNARLLPCKPRGVLSMILPDAETFGGFHVYKTTSWESIANIRTQLMVFEKQFGRLDGLPFKLKVYPATKGYGEGEGSTTQPIVTLVIAASFDTARQLGAAAAEESRRFLLAAGGAPDPEGVRRELVNEMETNVEPEGAEFFPEAGHEEGATMEERLRAQKGGALPVVQGRPVAPTPAPAPAPALQTSSGPAPTSPAAAAPAEDPGPDFEVMDPDEPVGADEPAVERMAWSPPEAAAHCRPGLEVNHRAYVDALREVVPEWTNDQVVAWQTEKVRKGSTRTWEAMDFDLASVFLRHHQNKSAPAAAGAGQQGLSF